MPEAAQFQELIRRVRNREEDAARELTLRYEKAIRRVVRLHLRDPRLRQVMDSMDVCQSVLASFFVRTALGQYELSTPEQLIGLLTTIARNKVANQVQYLRAKRRDIRRNTTLIDEEAKIEARSPQPDESLTAKEALDKVWERLSPQEQYLAEQRSHGRTWQSLADELGGTDEALRKKLGRSLDRVLAELRIDGESDA